MSEKSNDERLLSQNAHQGFLSPGLLVYPVLRLVDRNRIPLISSPSQKVQSPALSGYLPQKKGMVPSLLRLAPVSLLRGHLCRPD